MPKRCAICRCDATTTKFGFPVCWHHAEHGEDGPVCPTCNHPNPLSPLAEAINTAPKVAEAPFSLLAEFVRRQGKQGGLF